MTRVDLRSMPYPHAGARHIDGATIALSLLALVLLVASASAVWMLTADRSSSPTRAPNATPLVSGATSLAMSPTVPAAGEAVLPVAKDNAVFYVGGDGNEELLFVHLLSNGEILVAGHADDLSWLPNDTRRVELDPAGIDSQGQGVGFLLQLAPDLSTVRSVIHFPANTVGNIQRIRSTEVPGTATGVLYISGTRVVADPSRDGYFIARLRGNGVDQPISGIEWVRDISAPPRRASGSKGSSHYREVQPWDVGNDGRVIYGVGAEYDFDWAAMEALDAAGNPLALPGWPKEGDKSMIVLKAGRQGSLRSTTQQDFDFRTEDENGNPGRKGRFPDDYYFSGPLPAKGPGYTGYRTSDKPTQRLGQIAIDRRNNHLYFGYSTQTRLPGGNPDFEPAIVAMDDRGNIKWWARGYKEIERAPNDGGKNVDAINSPPDQYIDGVAIDYSANRLVVNARCHGNGVINYWAGNALKHSPNANGFQNRFTGSAGNIHIHWLGKYGLDDGRIYAATYVAEFADSSSADPFPDGKLAGWPNPNTKWPNVNTTRVGPDIAVDARGRVYLTGNGRRPFTTSDAYVSNLKPGQGVSAWSDFVRVYQSDFRSLDYSSLLRGKWDPQTGKSDGHETRLRHVVPVQDGLLVVGTMKKSETSDAPDVQTRNVPAWGADNYRGPTSGIVGLLKID